MIMAVIIFFISKRIYWIFLYLSTRTLLTFFLFLYLCFVLSKIFWIPILLVCFCCEVAQIRIPLNRNLDFAGRLFCPTLPLFNFLIVPLFIYDNALLAFFHHFWYTWFPFAIINLSCRFNYLFLLANSNINYEFIFFLFFLHLFDILIFCLHIRILIIS